MIFPFYIFLLLHWWLWFKKSHIKTFSQNDTTLRGAGYWFIPEALIRKTGSQHKVFPSFYSNEAEFALWCAALILETWGGDEIFRSNWPRQWCITELAGWVWKALVRSQWQKSVGQARAWRDGVTLLPPTPHLPKVYWITLWGAPSSSLFWPHEIL